MDRSYVGISFLCIAATLVFYVSGIAGDFSILSYSKPTWQSGTTSYTVDGISYNGDAGNALDNRGNETCTRTSKNLTSWWVVDLLDAYLIQQVAITPRPWNGASTNRMKAFNIEVSLKLDRATGELVAPWLCYGQSRRLPSGTPSLLPCYNRAMGRFVRITKSHGLPSALSMCHVDVYGVVTERSYSLVVRPGKRATGRVMERVFTRDAVECLTVCLKQPGCTSFNMAAGEETCDLIADTGYTYSENEQFDNGWTRYIVGIYNY